MVYLGPRDRNTDITENEEMLILEAFAESEEYLETGFVDDDYDYEPQD